MARGFMPRDLPDRLRVLTDLALDLRWTWSHAADALWRAMSPDVWDRTGNPWLILQDVPRKRLTQLARDPRFREELDQLVAARREYLSGPDWYRQVHPDAVLRRIAYFSMEFGLGEALPLYAGGLGILAGDYLKTASDLGVPAVGVGLLYQVGYFRQRLDADGRQLETYPYNDPTSLPIQPVVAWAGGWLHVPLALPGRTVLLRVWQARVGRTTLYLLDSNDPFNSPADRGITGELYGGGSEVRLMQEMVLGIAGWRLLEALGTEVDVCHLNEGHAAFVVVERARRFMEQQALSFREALWATRAGNVFTTHTPVAAGFDTFPPELVEKYFPPFGEYMSQLRIDLPTFLGLGREDPRDTREPFNMAYLALRGASLVNGVSRLHSAVSRRIFTRLYPRWPEAEVPVSHVTNGVHMPSWDSAAADRVWTEACGKGRWLGAFEPLGEGICGLSDEALWALRAEQRAALVRFARERLVLQLGQRGSSPEAVARARLVLDQNALTLGFARRFAGYKRPTLLLQQPERLLRVLTATERPVQIIVAGKAHPEDEEGKALVRAWLDLIRQPAVRSRAVFLEDYDISLAQALVAGVDVWINTPRRPWEACGTSGMKIVVNGGLNLSELDGWWAEAYTPEVGWALGDGQEHPDGAWDSREAAALYDLLEHEVIPAFYARDAQGLPRAWLARIRASMSRLAPAFSSNRMMRDYVEEAYRWAAAAFRRRTAEGGRLARELDAWATVLERHWGAIRVGESKMTRVDGDWRFAVPVELGEIPTTHVKVELYADPVGDEGLFRTVMEAGERIAGTINGYVFHAGAPGTRPAWHFTPRVVPSHPDAQVPIELPLIRWPL